MNKDKALGAYFGAAIGDAMGGPVECQHAERIRKVYGPIVSLLPYRKPPGLIGLQPGYAVTDTPGSITDDTFIRQDFAKYFLTHSPPWTASDLAVWLLENARREYWWPVALEPLKRIAAGEVSAEQSGMSHKQGGGNGWWTPIGILCAGDPDGAFAQAGALSRIWKAPLEQDLIGAIQAGLAAALADSADMDSVLDAMIAPCRPLARRLIERAVDTGRRARNRDDLVAKVYASLLVESSPTDADGPLPPPVEPVDYADGFYTSVLLAEQVAIEVAAFVFSRGDFIAIPNTVMIGRDCDSTATTVGSWVGALHGESGLPREWVEQVCHANEATMDLRATAEALWEARQRSAG